MSPRTVHYKKHFAEIFADAIDHELVCYSRSGFSNGAIITQLETALTQKPDLILFNLTNSDRIEFNITDSQEDHTQPYTINHVDTCSINLGEMSDPFYTSDSNRVIGSENLTTLLSDEPTFHISMRIKYSDWDNKIKAFQTYFKYIYNETWKNTIDQMMMHTMLYKLEKSNIPYIIVHDWLGVTLNVTYKPDWLTQKHTVHDLVNQIRLTMGPPHDNDPGFHLTFEGSEAVANVLIEHYNRYF